jgi:antitoxin (DNA-binding transcriptional repressor) of toxin-antitoxin stability system
LTAASFERTVYLYILESVMAEINVTTLRQHLPEYLARVERGERIRVTSRGRVIAEISPPLPEAGAAEAARARLRGSLVRYDQPLEPVLPTDEWEMNR